jgi:hypothetical protein
MKREIIEIIQIPLCPPHPIPFIPPFIIPPFIIRVPERMKTTKQIMSPTTRAAYVVLFIRIKLRRDMKQDNRPKD